MTDLAPVQALADLIGEDIPTTDTRLPAALRMASALVRAEAGTDFTLVEDDEVTLPGSLGYSIVLPDTPVVEVSEVSVLAWGYDEPEVLDVDAFEFSPYGVLLRTDRGSFGGLLSTVTVTYTHGFETVPEIAREITLSLAKRLVVFGTRFADQQVADPAAQTAIGLTDLERRALRPYRSVVVA